MIVKTGDESKIESFFDEGLEKKQKCPKCGKILTILKIGNSIEPVCDCEENND